MKNQRNSAVLAGLLILGALASRLTISRPSPTDKTLHDAYGDTPQSRPFRPVWSKEFNRFQCLNDNGKTGYNAISLKEFLTSKQGACANFEGAQIGALPLNHADLRGASLKGANFNGANLTGADLTGADIQNSFFIEATLRLAKLEHVTAWQTNFKRADMSDAFLTGGLFQKAIMEEADLYNARAQKTWLNGADLSRSRMDLAKLQGAHLSNFVISDIGGIETGDAKLTGAKLDGAQYDALTEFPADFDLKLKSVMRLVNE